MHGFSVIEEMHDNTIVNKMFDNSRINYMHGQSKIIEMHDDSVVESMYGNSIVELSYANSLVRKINEKAKILKKTIRSDQFAEKGRLPDFAGRYGGEEFVVVFVNCQKDMYHKGALRLLQALCEKPLIVPKEICGKEKDLELKVTASIGISLWSNSRFKTVDEWMKDADDALYKSKNNGRARVNSNYPEAVEWLP
jgi:diguanylate cyclase (GGDEF)-like protein